MLQCHFADAGVNSWNGGQGMRASRWIVTLGFSAVVVSLGFWAQESEPRDWLSLTKPSLVGLDFRQRPFGEIVRTIASRSGKHLVALKPMTKGAFPIGEPEDVDLFSRKVTLESPAPVPFWEAVDRLALASGLSYRLAEFEAATGVVFEGEGAAPGPACYSGPFRVGLIAMREYRENFFVRGPWVRFYPSGLPFPADAAELADAPKEGGPLFVEFEIAAEPGLVCRRNGPLRNLEAVDGAGGSILGSLNEDKQQSFRAFSPIEGTISPVVRVPLRKVEGKAASRSIRTLRGVIPVEIGTVRSKPAVVIRLGAAEGKTFQGGGAALTVTTDRIDGNGHGKLAFTCRLTGQDDPAVREARLSNLRTYQLRVLDDDGMSARFATGSSGGDGHGTLLFSYEYDLSHRSPGPPAEVRYYQLDRTEWDVPFEFHDVPLP